MDRKCVVKRCVNTNIGARGLCLKCYGAARYLIRERKTSWEELQRLGLAKATRAQLTDNPLVQALAAVRAKAQVAKARKRTK